MVEHLLAAIFATGEQNIRIEVDGEEIPILDGSALPWWDLLKQAGAQPCFRFFAISKALRIRSGRSTAHVVPIESDGAAFIEVILDLSTIGHPPMRARFHPGRGDFGDIALARTFAFETEVAALRCAGLAKGGSLENAVILGNRGPINPGGFRCEKEPALHKLLDFFGDMAFLGALPRARIALNCPGHHLHHKMVQTLMVHLR